MRLLLLPLMLLMTAPALAAPNDAWSNHGKLMRVAAAGIALPQTAGPVTLVKTGEITDPGTSLDNYAQYVSADNVIQATAYIYKPSYADAAIADIATERAIMARFGSATRRTAQTVVAAGGRAGIALRAQYEDAAEGRLVMAAAFVHAGPWIVKLRVTATSDRKADVNAAMDALLGGLAFDEGLTLYPAQVASISDCPVAAARMAEDGVKAASPAEITEQPTTSFPRDGHDALCRRGTVKVGLAQFDMLQPAQSGADGPLLVPTDDAGGMLRFERAAAGKGYQLTMHQVGRTEVYGRYDHLPDPDQIAAIIKGSDRSADKRLASTARASDGHAVDMETGSTN